MNKFLVAILGVACCAVPAAASELLPSEKREMTEIGTGQTKAVIAHGICRQITNNNASPVMVPHRTVEEWSVGENSFLAKPRVGLQVDPCPPQPPTAECFFWVSGIIPSYRNKINDDIAKIGDTSMTWDAVSGLGGSNIVGFGEYPDAYGSYRSPGPFHLAANGSFDGLAIGKDTKVTIYSEKNYSGDVLLDEMGPAVYVNGRWVSIDWKYENWSSGGPLFEQFPPETRHILPETTMHSWGHGSVKVTCK